MKKIREEGEQKGLRKNDDQHLTNDLFYKKDTDRNQVAGTDDDWDDPDTVVAEVKSNKKTLNKVCDSDFETDLDRKDSH